MAAPIWAIIHLVHVLRMRERLLEISRTSRLTQISRELLKQTFFLLKQTFFLKKMPEKVWLSSSSLAHLV